jgi:CheY-like chemotaxis protein
MPRLLWIDDDGPERFMNERRRLRKARWTVEWARGLQSAVERLTVEPFDAMLLDQMLPWPDREPGEPPDTTVEVWGGALLLWWLRRGRAPDSLGSAVVARYAEMWDQQPTAANRAMPVVVISAFDDSDVRAQLLEVCDEGEGGSPFDTPIWTKPVDLDALMAFLEDVKAHVEGRAAPAEGDRP